jgi:gluconolactonase
MESADRDMEVSMEPMRRHCCWILAFWLSPLAAGPANAATGAASCPETAASPLPPEAPLEELALPTAFEFLEGPVWIASEQALYLSAWNFSDPTDGRGPPTTILKWSNSAWSTFAPKGALRSNGLAVAPNGHLMAALHDGQEVARVSLADGHRTSVARTFQAKTFNSPNDLAVRKDGTVYFTDPDYQRDGRPGQGQMTGVYRVSPSGQVALVDGARKLPNGIALSPDESTLYVGSAESKIFRYAVASDGSTGAAQVFAETAGGVDGMTVDCRGNVYATIHEAKQVVVHGPTGALLGRRDLPFKVTNVAFGGADSKTLFITTAGHLYYVRALLPGAPY